MKQTAIILIVVGIVIILTVLISNYLQNKKAKKVQNNVAGLINFSGNDNFAAENADFLIAFQDKNVDWNKIYNMTQAEKDKLSQEIADGIYINVPVI